MDNRVWFHSPPVYHEAQTCEPDAYGNKLRELADEYLSPMHSGAEKKTHKHVKG